MQQPKLTLLICTHNGERTLQQALDAIAHQTDVSRDLFEVLVVDNASSDRTWEIASAALPELGLSGKVIQEPKIGKMNAFLTGIQTAQGELVSIIDDDNLIEPGFIRYMLELFDQHPNVGIAGSKNSLCIEQPVPSWFYWVNGRYACAQPMLEGVEEQPDGVLMAEMGYISGAGLTFRVQPIRQCLEKGYQFFNDCQRGSKMQGSSEDIELCFLIRSLGYRFAFDPRIQLRHAIRPDRLSLEYLKLLSRLQGQGTPGFDPFMFTQKHAAERLPLQWTWQWQLLSKLKRYFHLLLLRMSADGANEKLRFRNWVAREACLGAIQRILEERDRYTQHIRQVAAGEWTQLRVR